MTTNNIKLTILEIVALKKMGIPENTANVEKRIVFSLLIFILLLFNNI